MLAFSGPSHAAAAKPISKPNIILITSDDMGYDDLSLHGNPIIETPRLDSLAAQSLQFSDFNVSPVCATTRAALLTGRHYYKTGVSGVHGGRDYMRLDEVTIADVLANNGYKTGTWGKWHLGKTPGYCPWDRGFDEAYYSALYVHKNAYGYQPNQQGKVEKHKSQQWVSELITDKAINFIERNKQQPFFAYLSYLAPHEPWLAPKQYVDKYKAKGQREAIANLYGMIEEMDFHIGRLIDYLDESGLSNNTMVIFMSDNGPWFGSSNYGAMTTKEWQQRNPNDWHGMKGRNWQNGIKSPLFVRWPSKVKPKTVNAYVNVTDIFPTLVDVTGSKLETNHLPLDGESFSSTLLTGQAFKRKIPQLVGSHDVMSDKKHFNQWTPIDSVARDNMHYEKQMFALRDSRYKLIKRPVLDEPHYPKPTQGYLLFDMQNDPQESKNLVTTKPKIAKRMQAQMQQAYQNIFAANGSFDTPIYPVNAEYGVVNAFGPSRTGGNVKSQAHQLGGFKAKGDFAEYKIDIEQAGKYRIELDKLSHAGAGFNFKMTAYVLGKQVDSFTTQLSEYALAPIGQLDLPKGKVTLKFSMLSNDTMATWQSLNSLRRFYLIAAASSLTPADIVIPN
ncbi:sulfatase [Saccharobesus litoralis]|uniref:Sulfatase n=2 Tax=Saccharobesus litoralis TaxID=2172099 RepID=A0A2S0VXN0_9ALTE|nr:sulfatase [Saccharobesus litoralis]